jgi:hypothetical protein
MLRMFFSFQGRLSRPAYAESEMSIMHSTTCRDGVCKISALPCVQLQ